MSLHVCYGSAPSWDCFSRWRRFLTKACASRSPFLDSSNLRMLSSGEKHTSGALGVFLYVQMCGTDQQNQVVNGEEKQVIRVRKQLLKTFISLDAFKEVTLKTLQHKNKL